MQRRHGTATPHSQTLTPNQRVSAGNLLLLQSICMYSCMAEPVRCLGCCSSTVQQCQQLLSRGKCQLWDTCVHVPDSRWDDLTSAPCVSKCPRWDNCPTIGPERELVCRCLTPGGMISRLPQRSASEPGCGLHVACKSCLKATGCGASATW